MNISQVKDILRELPRPSFNNEANNLMSKREHQSVALNKLLLIDINTLRIFLTAILDDPAATENELVKAMDAFVLRDREWAVQQFIQCLSHINLLVRWVAVGYLGNLGDPAATMPILQQLEGSHDPIVMRIDMLHTLEKCGTSAALPLLHSIAAGANEFDAIGNSLVHGAQDAITAINARATIPKSPDT